MSLCVGIFGNKKGKSMDKQHSNTANHCLFDSGNVCSVIRYCIKIDEILLRMSKYLISADITHLLPQSLDI